MVYSCQLCNAEGGGWGASKTCFFLSVKVLKDNRHIELVDFNTESNCRVGNSNTQRRIPQLTWGGGGGGAV